jgi:1,4-dihydroxy-2-naphthoate octaprenyltransferase
MASRPATLTAAIAPVAVGAAVAYHSVGFVGLRVGAIAAALLGAMCIQIGTNLANDVFDHEKGADTKERLGPTRVTQAGLLTPGEVRRGMILAFAAAILAGVYLAAVAGAPIVVIGLASIASGVAYTGGPYPLGYNGLGDVFVFLFFGVVAVCGTTFVATGVVPWLALLASVPVGALATAVLVVNNVRDRATDVVAGKRTLVVRFGRRFGTLEYVVLWVLACVGCAAMAALTASPWPLIALLVSPMGVRLARTVAGTEGAALNETLASTAKALLALSMLLSLGVVVAR